MKTVRETLIAALSQYRGDDLCRARAAFRGLSPTEMDKEHGQSGFTRRQILSQYEEHGADCDAALAWVKANA